MHDVSQTIDLENEQLNGGFIVKALFISVDPYLRGRMRPADVPSYLVCMHVDFFAPVLFTILLLACLSSRPAVSSSLQ